MRASLAAWLSFGISLLIGVAASAQQRCDCSQQTADCRAAVSYAGGLLQITTDIRQCAQVLFYIDGQPHVALVTDGRAAKQQPLTGVEKLSAGQCRVCAAVEVSNTTQLQVISQCDEDLLMPTAATKSCLQECSTSRDSRDKKVCELNCRQHSRCLERNCVDALTQQLTRCERRCDRELQSSMEADIDVYRRCHSACEKIKKEITSCPVI